MGCYEVSLGDTTGAGTPAKVATIIRYLEKNGVPLNRLAGHFHDTYGQAVANVLQAYLCGIKVFDASVGGLGGCPFAPGAKGNVSTEDLVLMFHNAGIHMGINLPELTATGNWINQQVRGGSSTSSSESLNNSYMMEIDVSSSKGPRVKELQLPTFRPITYVKTSLKRTKHADQLRIFQTGSDLNVVLNRPYKGNALTKFMIIRLIKCVKSYSTDPSVSRIVISGTGKYFCAGPDMREYDIEESSTTPTATDLTHSDLLMQLFEVIDLSPKPVIACLNGHACGAGVALAFACDERIMVQTATISLNQTRRSLFTDLISRYVTREWGSALSSSSQVSNFSARPMSGAELQVLGLVTELVEGTKDLQTKLGGYLFVKEISAKTAVTTEKI